MILCLVCCGFWICKRFWMLEVISFAKTLISQILHVPRYANHDFMPKRAPILPNQWRSCSFGDQIYSGIVILHGFWCLELRVHARAVSNFARRCAHHARGTARIMRRGPRARTFLVVLQHSTDVLSTDSLVSWSKLHSNSESPRSLSSYDYFLSQ